MRHLYVAHDDGFEGKCVYCGGTDAASRDHYDRPESMEEALEILIDLNDYTTDVTAWVNGWVGVILGRE